MKAKLKKRWVKALRSGRYKQTRQTLQNEAGANCCLGVLCRIARVPQELRGTHLYFGGDGYLNGNVELSDDLLEKFGMLQEQQKHLVVMNDGDADAGDGTGAFTFGQIANWIEKNL